MKKSPTGVIMTMQKKTAALMAVLVLLLALSACEAEDQPAFVPSDSNAAAPAYPVGSYERKAADRAASGEDDPSGNKTDFGSKSIFKGITVESDENGELVCLEKDGELWYKVADSRFGSYAAFKKYVTKKSGKAAVEQYAPYFWDMDGDLYFVDGANGRSVKDRSLYYLDDATKLTVSVTHTDQCARKYGITRSQIHFVRDKKNKGVWKLSSLVIYSE